MEKHVGKHHWNLSPTGLSSFALKLAAIFGMTCNHAAYLFGSIIPFPIECILFAAGGITFPVMAFLLVEGYTHTSSVRKYAARLLAFALVSQIPYSLFLDSNGNVLFTLLIGLSLLHAHDHMENRIGFWMLAAGGCAASLLCDWGFLGVAMVLMFKVMRGEAGGIAAPVGLAIASVGLPALSDMVSTGVSALPALLYPFAGCSAAIPLISTYNGRRGRPLKWLFYAYYPAHIAILGLVHILVTGSLP